MELLLALTSLDPEDCAWRKENEPHAEHVEWGLGFYSMITPAALTADQQVARDQLVKDLQVFN